MVRASNTSGHSMLLTLPRLLLVVVVVVVVLVVVSAAVVGVALLASCRCAASEASKCGNSTDMDDSQQ